MALAEQRATIARSTVGTAVAAMLHARPGAWRGLISLAAGVALWEFAARTLVANQLFFVPLSAVFVRAAELWSTGELQTDIAVSGVEVGGGFVLAAVVGVGLGVLMAASKILRDFLDPWMTMLYATPIIALGPLFILSLGIGVASKIAIIFLTAVFPIVISTQVGLATTDANFVDVARSFGGSTAQIYRKVRVPSAIPFIIGGLRISVARALVGMVVAELFGARAGLGFLIFNATSSFDTAGLFVAVLILAVTGVCLVELLKWAERRLAPWRNGIAE